MQVQKCKCKVHLYSDSSFLSASSALSKWIECNWADLELVNVKGSLKRSAASWEKLTSDSFLLSVVKNGSANILQEEQLECDE